MSTPRHRSAPGSSYFVTTKCHQNRNIFQIPEVAQILVQTLLYYRDQNAYLLHEFVVMPDHLHLILAPSETTSPEKAIGLIKGGSSHRIPEERDHKMEIWQQGFYDWTIRDANDWHTKLEYIRTNPVHARLAASPTEWPHTSARSEFRLDPMPARFFQGTSGAEAPLSSAHASGLKPRPPEEQKQKSNSANITLTSGSRSKGLLA